MLKKRPSVKTVSNYLWVYPKDYNREKILLAINDGVYDFWEKPVWQVAVGRTPEEPGSVVAKFSSSAEAKRVTGIGDSHLCANNQKDKKVASGYTWVYPEDYDRDKILRDIEGGVFESSEKEVWQISIGLTHEEPGSVVAKFSSLTEAGKTTKIDISTIGHCASNKEDYRNVQTAKNYTWCYPEDYNRDKILKDIEDGFYYKGKGQVSAIIIGEHDEPPANFGKVLQEFPNAQTGRKILGGNPDIALKKEYGVTMGYFWCYAKEYTEEVKLKLIEKINEGYFKKGKK